MAGTQRPDPGTAARILDSAEALVQVRAIGAVSKSRTSLSSVEFIAAVAIVVGVVGVVRFIGVPTTGGRAADGITIGDVVDSGVSEFLEELAAKLRSGTYRSKPLRRVRIPKPGRPGQLRPLGIPCVADRVVMAAAKIVLEAIFEADFLPTSYGFRPGRSAHHALETVRQTVTWRGKAWVLDADIQSCLVPSSHCLSVHGGCVKEGVFGLWDQYS